MCFHGHFLMSCLLIVNVYFIWIIFSDQTAARTAALDLGFHSTSAVDRSQARFVYLLGADDAFKPDDFGRDAFIVYQGHHGDLGALQADVILPGLAYTEKNGVYVNTEGRAQSTHQATNGPSGVRFQCWNFCAQINIHCDMSTI